MCIIVAMSNNKPIHVLFTCEVFKIVQLKEQIYNLCGNMVLHESMKWIHIIWLAGYALCYNQHM